MTPPKIVTEALALPAEEREELAAMLLDSLEAPAAISISIEDVDEIKHRADAIRSGEDPGVSWSDLRKRLEG